MKWFATILFLCAGTLLAFNVDASKYGFLLFFVGHVTLGYYFLKEKDWPMVTQNVFFLIIDSIGITRWFF